MNVTYNVARILFGLAFTLAGAAGLYLDLFTPGPPPMAGFAEANAFQVVAYQSHYILFVAAVQLITGILLLIDRYVALALMATAAVLFNILAFHITMFPMGIFPGLILTACWIVIALRHKPALLPILSPRA